MLVDLMIELRRETLEYEKGQAYQPISDDVLALISKADESKGAMCCISDNFDTERGFYLSLLPIDVTNLLSGMAHNYIISIEFCNSDIKLIKNKEETENFKTIEELAQYLASDTSIEGLREYHLCLPQSYATNFDSVVFCQIKRKKLSTISLLYRYIKNTNALVISDKLISDQIMLTELFHEIDCAFVISNSLEDSSEKGISLPSLTYTEIVYLDKLENKRITQIHQLLSITTRIRLVKKLSSIVEAVMEESSSSIDKLTKQKKREEQNLRSHKSKEFDLHSALQTRLNTLVNTGFNDALDKLESELKLQSRQKSIIDNFNSSIVNKLSLSNFKREKKQNGFKLTIQQSLIDESQLFLHKAFEKKLEQNKKLYNDLAESTVKSVVDELKVSNIDNSSIGLIYPNEAEFWRSAQYIFELELDYSGELKKRGFFKRLSEGRRAVFSLLMAVSLGGTMFGFSNLRSNKLIGLLLFLTFIFSVVFTYRSWRAEDKETEEKEIERAKESIKRSAQQCLLEAERDYTQWIKNEFAVLKKHIQQSIADAIKIKTANDNNQKKTAIETKELLLHNITKKLDESVTLNRKLESIHQEVKKEEAEIRRQLFSFKQNYEYRD